MTGFGLQGLLHAIGSHPYIFLFIGLLFAGETILLPAVYFALSGSMSLPYVLSISLLATTVADTFWYFVGAHAKERFFRSMIEGRVKRTLARISGAFSKKGFKLLYLSKFVYGARIAAQVLAGAERMPFGKYIAVNVCGIATLVGVIALVAYSVRESLESIGSAVHRTEIALLVFASILFGIHALFGAYFKKRWSRR